MNIVDIAAVAHYAAGKMQKVSLFDSARFFCDLYCLEPGQSQRSHIHSGEDKVYVVLEGEPTLLIAGQREILTPGKATHAPAGAEHGIENNSDARVRMLVFMAPRPAAN